MTEVSESGQFVTEEDQVFFDRLTEIFNEKIPFNRLLQLKVDTLSGSDVRMGFDMREELVGNFMRGNLHGGVISSVLDVIGGLVAFLSMVDNNPGTTLEEKINLFKRLGTIDLRIDYLRPGMGQSFVVSGYVLRAGKKVTVTRMELHNDKKVLIAVGTGAYIVG